MSGNEGLAVRNLRREDYDHGYLELLNELTDVGTVSRSKWEELFDRSVNTPTQHYVVVEDKSTEACVGAATLVVEYKFIHEGKCVGHIEDVVVLKKYRGRRLGKLLVDKLVEISKENDCYKVILDCADNTIPFYEKTGFRVKERQMRLDL